MSPFRPKLITVLREGYPRGPFPPGQLTRDILAGIIVGIVAVPLAIAFAIASGVGPERGLYTAVVAGFLISRSAAAACRSADPPARSSCSCTPSCSSTGTTGSPWPR